MRKLSDPQQRMLSAIRPGRPLVRMPGGTLTTNGVNRFSEETRRVLLELKFIEPGPGSGFTWVLTEEGYQEATK